MTACRCHDPIVFGHDWFCERGLGPPGDPSRLARRHDFRPDPIAQAPKPDEPELITAEIGKWRRRFRNAIAAYSEAKLAEAEYGAPPFM